MFRNRVWILLALSLVWAGACRPVSPAGEAAPSQPAVAPSPEVQAGTPAAGETGPAQDGATEALDAAELEILVVAALAESLGARTGEITVVQAASATWPDRGLGCAVRRGFFPAEATPGYRIVLEHDGQRYEYHTDEFGAFVRCPEVGKPIDPIQ